MSKTIDQKVVEMRFDNKNFEENVKQSLSTLDKLKSKLNLSGASKGLENINKSASKVSFSNMENSLAALEKRFSTTGIIGMSVIHNLTTQLMSFSRKITGFFSGSIISGGIRRATNLENAKFQLDGLLKDAKAVADVMQNVNDAVDGTAYSLDAAANVASQLAASGMRAGDEMFSALRGVAGVAAMTNSTYEDIGRIYTQVAGQGRLMGDQLLQLSARGMNAAATLAEHLGVTEAEVRDMTSKGKISFQIFAEAMDNAFGEHAKKANETFNGALANVKSALARIGAEFVQPIIQTNGPLVNFLNALRERINEIKKAIVPFAKVVTAKLGDIINGFANILKKKSVFSYNPLEKFIETFNKLKATIDKTTQPIQNAANSVKNVVDSVKDYSAVVDEIIAGKWGNAPTRWQDLTNAGYDWAHAQNLVNERLGSSVRYATNYKEAQQELTTSQEKLNESTIDFIAGLIKLSDAQLEEKGYTKEQIEAFRELEKVSKKTGIPIKDLLQNIDQINGRWLIFNSFKNIGQGIIAVLKSIKDAWAEVFPSNPDTLFNILAGLHKLSTYLRVSDETADKLKRTFKGVFAILDIILTLIGGPIKLGFKIFIQLLNALGFGFNNILDVTAAVGDAIVKFRDWLDSILDFTGVFKILVPYLKKGAIGVRNWIISLKDSEIIKIFVKYLKDAKDVIIEWSKHIKDLGENAYIKKFIKYLKESKDAISDWIKGIKEADDIPKYIFEGLINGLSSGAKGIITFIVNFGKQLIDAIKNVLGIHSPSTEFFEIGKNMMLGLFNGISEFVKLVYSLLTTIGGKLIEIIKGLDIGSIFTIIMGLGLVYSFKKIADAIEILTGPLESLDSLIVESKKVLKSFKGVLNTFKFKIIADSIKSLATAIAILAGSIALLTMLDQSKMWSAVGAITVMVGLLAGLTYIAGSYGKEGKGLEFGKIALSLLGLAIAMAIMAKALKTISGIDPDKAFQVILGFAGIVSAMVLMMKILGENGQQMTKLGTTLTSIGIALLLMAVVTKMLGKIDPKVLTQGTLAIMAFSGIIVSLIWATKLINGSKNVDSIGKTISKIAGAILIMAMVAKIAGKMDPKELDQGITAITEFGGIIVGLILATKLINGSKNVDKIGKAISGISSALLMMVIVAKIAGKMDPKELDQGITAIAAFGGIIAGLMWATKLINGSKNVDKIGKALFMISLSIGLMAASAALLSLIDPGNLAKGVIAVGFISAMLAGLIYVTKYAKDVKGTMIAITVAIGILVLAIAALSMIEVGKLAKATLAISAVMGMFALIIKATGSINGSVGTLIVLTIAVGLLAGALYLVAQLPVDRALAASVSLSLLLGTLAGVMYILNSMGSLNAKALLGVFGIVALCIPLYMIVDVLSKMQGIENASSNALVLAAFMGALAVVQLLCAAAGAIYAATGEIAATGLLGMIGLIGSLYLVVGVLSKMANVPNAITNLIVLTSFMTIMSKMLIGLAIVGPLALVGVTAMNALLGLMVTIGVLAVSIGALMEKFPAIEDFLNNGIPIMVKLAGGIGQMLGAFVSNILSGITDTLPKIGSDLSLFMLNATPFIIGAKMIDSKMIDGVKSLAEAILIITGTDIIQGMTSWLTGGNSISDFGTQIGELGTSLNTFVTNLGTFDESKIATVNCAGKAIKALADAASKIPNEGGLWGAIVGENSLTSFGGQLPVLATYLNGFITNLGTFDESKLTVVDCAGKAIKALAEAASKIPNEGGLWASIVGDNGLASFGNKLPGLATNLNGFITNLGTFDESKITTVDCACKAIKSLASAANSIPNEGGLWASIVGDNSLATFASKLPDLATNIADFVTNLGEFTEGQVTTVNSACKAIKTIASLGKIDIKDTGSGLKSFGENMVKFAGKIKSFVNELNDIKGDGITSAIKKTKQLINMAKTVGEVNISSLKTFSDSLKKVAKDGVKGFVKEFSGASPKDDAKKATKALLNAAIEGAESKKPDVKKKFKTVAEDAAKALSSQTIKDTAKSAGKDLVQGFADGISQNTYISTAKSITMAKAAVQAAKDELKINSPSKVFRKIGSGIPEGFAQGISMFGSDIKRSVTDMSNSAINNTKKVISRIANAINTDIDSQPTIRPVLDLSDVESGTNYLNSMFNNGPSIGVMANLNAISSSMSNRSQNGSNADVVSAINKLSKNLGNVGGDTYNINGITYDDGSNVSNAVSTLIRAVNIERRT